MISACARGCPDHHRKLSVCLSVTVLQKRLLVVIEEELQRIVLDIHDGPVQHLFAALSQLTVLRSRISGLQPSPEEFVATINRTISLLEVSLGDIRDLPGTFCAPEFARSELTEIIEDIVIQHESFTSSAVTLEMSKLCPEPISLRVKIALCRILQESLSNVRRHSGGQEAAVKLWAEKALRKRLPAPVVTTV
jgi:signal transduction histidine kinase